MCAPTEERAIPVMGVIPRRMVNPMHTTPRATQMTPAMSKCRSGTLWIFLGLVFGIFCGGFLPQDLHPTAYNLFVFLSKAFISLIKGLIVPLLFSTIVGGIAQTGNLKAVGRMGGKALLYFEIVTTLALFLGLGLANLLKPGSGLTIDTAVRGVGARMEPMTGWEMALHAFPSNVVHAAAEGDILPLVVFATLFGVALTRVGDRGKPILIFFQGIAETMFKYTDLVMVLTPFGVFGSMAYNVSHMAAAHVDNGMVVKGWPAIFGLLKQYAILVGSVYLSLFILAVAIFVPVLVICRVRVSSFFRSVRDPIITAYSTASSEAALPSLLERVVEFGVPRRVAAFVIPAGYSFNLDGSSLYLILASLSIAQAAHISMSFGQQLAMSITFLLSSKGLAGVPRAGLVVIAATCDSFGLPGEAGIAMLLAVEAVLDMARAAANVTGNAIASVVIAKWEGVFGSETSFDQHPHPEADAKELPVDVGEASIPA